MGLHMQRFYSYLELSAQPIPLVPPSVLFALERYIKLPVLELGFNYLD